VRRQGGRHVIRAEPPVAGRAPLTRVRTWLLLGAIVLLWGVNYPFVKLALDDVGPIAFTAIRFCGAAILIGALLVLTGRRLLPCRGERGLLALIGLTQVALAMGLSVVGMQWIGAGRAAVLMYTMHLWAIPLSLLIFGQRPGRWRLLGGAIGLIGLVVFFNPAQIEWGHRKVLLGNGLVLAAAILWAVGACLYGARRWRSGFWEQLFWQFLVSSPPLLALAYASGEIAANWTTRLVLILFYNWTVATALGFWCWSRVLTLMPTAIAGQGVMLTPLVGYAGGVLLTGDTIGVDVIASVLLIVGGLWLTFRKDTF